MSTLTLRVDRDFPGHGAPLIYASIRQLNTEDSSTLLVKKVLIPITRNADAAATETIEPGFYQIDVQMPAGELFSQQLRITDDENHELALGSDWSEEGEFPWQQFLGSARPTSATTKKTAMNTLPSYADIVSVPRRRNGVRVPSTTGLEASVPRSGDLQAYTTRSSRSVIEVFDSSEGNRRVKVIGGPLYYLSDTHPNFSRTSWTTQQWKALNTLNANPGLVIESRRDIRSLTTLEAIEKGKDFAVYRFTRSAGKGKLWDSPEARKARDCFIVIRRRGYELVCLPTPWVDRFSRVESAVEILVTKPATPHAFMTSIAIHDDRVAVMLGYMASGSLPDAKEILMNATTMLHDKFHNPQAAAAGGYILIATAKNTKREHWHVWIKNLMNGFDELPDGAILYATLKLRMRKDAVDVLEAVRALKIAYSRGLPVYSMGLRWLVEGLELVQNDDEELKQMLKDVRSIAARCHPQSVFTILGFGDH
jgi:hypothetical protein